MKPPTSILVLAILILACPHEVLAAGSRFRVRPRNSNSAEPSTSVEKEQDNLQDVVGELVAEASSITGGHPLADKSVVADPSTLPSTPTENVKPMPHQGLPKVGSPLVEEIIQGMQTMREVIGELKSKNATMAKANKQPLANSEGAPEADPQQDDHDEEPKVIEAQASKMPSGAAYMNTGNDPDEGADDAFMQTIRKHVMGERATRLHLRQKISKLAIAERDLQHRLASSQDSAADLQRQLHAVRSKGKKLREQLDQSRKTAAKRESQMRKQLDAQTQRAKDQVQKLRDLRRQAHSALTNMTNQLQAAHDVVEKDERKFKEQKAVIAKLQVGMQRVKAAGDAALKSAEDKVHKMSMESKDRERFLTVQIQQLHSAIKKQAKALTAELAHAKQRANLLQTQMGDLTKHEHTEVANLKADLSRSHDHEEKTKDELTTRISDLQASVQKEQEARAAQDRDLGSKQHEIEQMKAIMKTEASAMKAQKVRIRRLFQESRKEEKKQKRTMEGELKKAQSKVTSLERTMSTIQANASKMLANMTGALSASHEHELKLATERTELRRELRSNESMLQAETAEVAALKKRLAEEENARKKAENIAHKAHAEAVQAKAVASQLQGTVPQLLEQVQLAHEKRDAEKAMRIQAQAIATNDVEKSNTAAEKQMQKQVEQIDKVLPLMNSAASQAALPAPEEDDMVAGEQIDKAIDGPTQVASAVATPEGSDNTGGTDNTDASNLLAPASGGTATDPDPPGGVVADLPDLDKDGASLAALVQN
mmetsp:Transcript_108874/g.216211  ORF Transcript_108874/g.216211 Transcript_108874/m.216211 type:complete len:769 (+) Transcript_108874:54-2360(+)